MSDSNTYENDLLKYELNGTALPSYMTGPFYVALYTADPGESGTATTSEAAYTSYARQSIARTTGGFTVVGNSATNAAQINFPACTGGSATVTHWGLVSSSSGAGTLIKSGPLNASLVVTTTVAPQIDIGGMVITRD
jgi:hypothetical protein